MKTFQDFLGQLETQWHGITQFTNSEIVNVHFSLLPDEVRWGGRTRCGPGINFTITSHKTHPRVRYPDWNSNTKLIIKYSSPSNYKIMSIKKGASDSFEDFFAKCAEVLQREKKCLRQKIHEQKAKIMAKEIFSISMSGMLEEIFGEESKTFESKSGSLFRSNQDGNGGILLKQSESTDKEYFVSFNGNLTMNQFQHFLKFLKEQNVV